MIAESDAVQEFLTDSDDSSNPTPVDLKVLLPDKEVVTVSVLKSTNADDVYRAVCEKIGLSKSVQKYFYLFEIVEYNFGKFNISIVSFIQSVFSIAQELFTKELNNFTKELNNVFRT